MKNTEQKRNAARTIIAECLRSSPSRRQPRHGEFAPLARVRSPHSKTGNYVHGALCGERSHATSVPPPDRILQNFDGSQRWHDKARLNRQTERNQMNKRLQEAPRVSQHAGAKVAKRFVLQQRKLQAHPCIAASPAGVLLIRIDAMWSRCHAVNLWLPLPTPSPATPATGSCRCRSGAAGRRSPPGEELCKRPYADATSS